MKNLANIYYLTFYKLYVFFRSLSDDGWEKSKAMIIVCNAQVIIFFECWIWLSILFKDIIPSLSHPAIVFAPFALFIAAINYYFLFQKDKWKNYEHKFKTYSKQKSRLYGWLIFLFLFSIVCSLIFAFYQMSMIDWSIYR